MRGKSEVTARCTELDFKNIARACKASGAAYSTWQRRQRANRGLSSTVCSSSHAIFGGAEVGDGKAHGESMTGYAVRLPSEGAHVDQVTKNRGSRCKEHITRVSCEEYRATMRSASEGNALNAPSRTMTALKRAKDKTRGREAA